MQVTVLQNDRQVRWLVKSDIFFLSFSLPSADNSSQCVSIVTILIHEI
jgi:hypothetical protein